MFVEVVGVCLMCESVGVWLFCLVFVEVVGASWCLVVVCMRGNGERVVVRWSAKSEPEW